MKHFTCGWSLLLFASAALIGCETVKPQVQVPPQLLYFQAEALTDQELYSEAITKFQQVADQNPGTRLGTYAYLKLAELHAKKQDWEEAETNFRLFVSFNTNSPVVPYVLYRLLEVHHQESYTGVFFPTREVDRDMEPNRKILREYTRFYFLFPKSMYQKNALHFYEDAREILAEHERVVGNFYYNRSEYNSAAHRYLYLLRNYPQYQNTKNALRLLILSYRNNQQPGLAHEMEQTYQRLFKEPPPGVPRSPDKVTQGGADQSATVAQTR